MWILKLAPHRGQSHSCDPLAAHAPSVSLKAAAHVRHCCCEATILLEPRLYKLIFGLIATIARRGPTISRCACCLTLSKSRNSRCSSRIGCRSNSSVKHLLPTGQTLQCSTPVFDIFDKFDKIEPSICSICACPIPASCVCAWRHVHVVASMFCLIVAVSNRSPPTGNMPTRTRVNRNLPFLCVPFHLRVLNLVVRLQFLVKLVS